MKRLLVNPFDFELAPARELAFVFLLLAAVLSPNFSMPGSLPAIRLEQVMLAGYLPLLGLHYWHHRELWRVGLVDLAFVALGVAMAITLAAAPLFLNAVSWSLRDPFEIARVVEYWVLFRLALTLDAEQAWKDAVVILPGLGVLLGIFAFFQYVDPGSFNDTVTGVWAVSHNLDGVERAGRTVGTIGNANYFGAFSGLLLIVALAVIALRRPRRWMYGLMVLAVLCTAFSMVSAQSRTAVLGVLIALTVGAGADLREGTGTSGIFPGYRDLRPLGRRLRDFCRNAAAGRRLVLGTFRTVGAGWTTHRSRSGSRDGSRSLRGSLRAARVSVRESAWSIASFQTAMRRRQTWDGRPRTRRQWTAI